MPGPTDRGPLRSHSSVSIIRHSPMNGPWPSVFVVISPARTATSVRTTESGVEALPGGVSERDRESVGAYPAIIAILPNHGKSLGVASYQLWPWLVLQEWGSAATDERQQLERLIGRSIRLVRFFVDASHVMTRGRTGLKRILTVCAPATALATAVARAPMAVNETHPNDVVSTSAPPASVTATPGPERAIALGITEKNANQALVLLRRAGVRRRQAIIGGAALVDAGDQVGPVARGLHAAAVGVGAGRHRHAPVREFFVTPEMLALVVLIRAFRHAERGHGTVVPPGRVRCSAS